MPCAHLLHKVNGMFPGASNLVQILYLSWASAHAPTQTLVCKFQSDPFQKCLCTMFMWHMREWEELYP